MDIATGTGRVGRREAPLNVSFLPQLTDCPWGASIHWNRDCLKDKLLSMDLACIPGTRILHMKIFRLCSSLGVGRNLLRSSTLRYGRGRTQGQDCISKYVKNFVQIDCKKLIVSTKTKTL